MKALTIRQPFAHAIIEGRKPVENRNGISTVSQARKLVGQRVAIHVSAWWRRSWMGMVKIPPGEGQRFLQENGDARMYRGAIIGTAVIDRVIERGDGDPLHSNEWRIASDRWGIVFRDPQRCAPRPAKGLLGFWEVKE